VTKSGGIVPIYQGISLEGLLDESQRENIAGEITRIHCDATGAPRSFVDVVFQDMQNGHSILFGDIRAAGMSRHGRRCFEICR
jgi:phenylpyruvate tautomerase PptA (4-oxalocrotonate tautomerase family)